MRRPTSRLFAAALAAAALALGGCQGRDLDAMSQPEIVEVVTPATSDLQPVALAGMVADLRRGTRIGKFEYAPLSCDPIGGDIEWGVGVAKFKTDEMTAVVADYMRTAGVLVTNDPSNPFQRLIDGQDPTYYIAGRISEVFVNGCMKTGILGRGHTGDGLVRVNWRVLAVATEEVVFEMAADGRYKLDTPSEYGLSVIIEEAVGRSAEKLARNAAFREAISHNPLLVAREEDNLRLKLLSRMRLEPLPLSTSPIQEQMRDVRASTVRIDTGGGHGSGFLVAPELVLTNAHVVRNHDIVDVVLASGRAVIGEVVRLHRTRDVALIKIEPVRFPFRPLRLAPPEIGEEIYVAGAPLRRTNQGNVTRGIVSRYEIRPDGMTDIVFDARVYGGNSGGPIFDRFGNIVGLVYASQADGGEAVQINLGIPLDEALEMLKIEAAPEPEQTAAES